MLCCALGVAAALAAASTCHPAAARLPRVRPSGRLDQTGMRHEPVDEAFIASWIATSREAMGAAAFDAAEATGKALSYDAALAEMGRLLRGE